MLLLSNNKSSDKNETLMTTCLNMNEEDSRSVEDEPMEEEDEGGDNSDMISADDLIACMT